jgi:rSAM/selenodomain-associated transferase 1
LDDRCLLFFIKNPEEGQVKTRLASAVGRREAMKLYRSFLLEMLYTLNKGTFLFYLFYFPENALDDLKDWLGDHYLYMPQRGGDLGERMKHGFGEAFSMNFNRVVLIGSDIPDLPLEFIDEAFAALQEHDGVIGPSLDGGYYLIGFKNTSFSPRVFDGIRWSTGAVFEKTLEILNGEGRTVHILQSLRDIDTVEDLKIRALLGKKE